MNWKGESPNRLRGRRWDAIRKRILARDPICRECLRKGTVNRYSVSTIVDHIVPLFEGGSNDDSNLEGQCQQHGKEKTARESARARGIKYRERSAVGVDGWPLISGSR